jgi:predicted nucleic acid-binding protein
MEVTGMVNERRSLGRGLGWIDAHGLASALISNCGLWTLDQRLERAASKLGIP